MRSLDNAKYIEQMPDGQLRDYMYFLCGWQPMLMSAVVGKMQQLDREKAELCDSSHAKPQESSPDQETKRESG